MQSGAMRRIACTCGDLVHSGTRECKTKGRFVFTCVSIVRQVRLARSGPSEPGESNANVAPWSAYLLTDSTPIGERNFRYVLAKNSR
jgi:hypothetical protein